MMTSYLATSVVIVLMTLSETSATCHRNVIGRVTCQEIKAFDSPQWATCLTNDYYSYKSKGRLQCQQDATQCYYPCMQELNNREEGRVNRVCGCSAEIDPPVDNSVNDECYSPSGTECRWYSRCLNAKYKCPTESKDDDDYGIRFGEKFCGIQTKTARGLSLSGSQWLEAAIRCLQVELVPLIRPFQSAVSCSDIRATAIQSYTDCYQNPFRKITSICAMGKIDFWHIFWNIKATYTSSFVEEIYGILVIRGQCQTFPPFLDYMTKLEIRVTLNECSLHDHCILKRSVGVEPSLSKANTNADEKITENARARDGVFKRSVNNDDASSETTSTREEKVTESSHARAKRASRAKRAVQWQGETEAERHYHKGAAEVVSELAYKAGWDSKNIYWFTYADFDSSTNLMKIHVLLANKTQYLSSGYDMRDVVREAAQMYQNGELRFTVDGVGVPAGVMSGCNDRLCESLYLQVTGGATRVAGHVFMTSCLLAVLSVAAVAALSGDLV